ncbi:hypothetical protein KXR53_16835 [Inquilinus limosus]|uniref:hypothetical protein n=1 Tax=Inquilinus limosus TaxID=171674 RepID=UPI003F16ED5D
MILSALRIGIRVALWAAAIVSLLAILMIALVALSRQDNSKTVWGSIVLIAGIIVAWLAGYGGVVAAPQLSANYRRTLRRDDGTLLPLDRRVLLVALQAVFWPIIVAPACVALVGLIYSIGRLPSLGGESWAEPAILSGICAFTFLACLPLWLRDLLERLSHRLRRLRWASPPGVVVHRVSRLWQKDGLALAALVSSCVSSFLLAFAQLALRQAGFVHPAIGMTFTAMVGLSAVGAVTLARKRRRRIELILDDAGLHFVANKGWSVPWDAISDVRMISFRANLVRFSQLSLVIDRPERFGIHVGRGWRSWLRRWPVMKANAWVPLYVFLERPKHIVADIKAFMARAKSEGAAAGSSSGP